VDRVRFLRSNVMCFMKRRNPYIVCEFDYYIAGLERKNLFEFLVMFTRNGTEVEVIFIYLHFY